MVWPKARTYLESIGLDFAVDTICLLSGFETFGPSRRGAKDHAGERASAASARARSQWSGRVEAAVVRSCVRARHPRAPRPGNPWAAYALTAAYTLLGRAQARGASASASADTPRAGHGGSGSGRAPASSPGP